MRLVQKMVFLLTCMTTCASYAQNILAHHEQLLVVTTQGWNEKQGTLSLYQRRNGDAPWTPVQTSIPVVVGKNGLAWGIGLHPQQTQVLCKKEGDGKAPAGIFALGKAFGFATASEMKKLQLAYIHLNEHIEAVDDPLSSHYNRIVDRREVSFDWTSSEKMSEVSLYTIGLEVHHNFPNPQAGAGSAIFLHIWRSPTSGTAGCTAMDRKDLDRILCWLDPTKNPVLVQLPIEEYQSLKNSWHLP